MNSLVSNVEISSGRQDVGIRCHSRSILEYEVDHENKFLCISLSSFIGLDDTFMKIKFTGVLLMVVGVDAEHCPSWS